MTLRVSNYGFLSSAVLNMNHFAFHQEETIEETITRLFRVKVNELSNRHGEKCDSIDILSFGDLILELLDSKRESKRKGAPDMDYHDWVSLFELLTQKSAGAALLYYQPRDIAACAQRFARKIDPYGSGDVRLERLLSFVKSVQADPNKFIELPN